MPAANASASTGALCGQRRETRAQRLEQLGGVVQERLDVGLSAIIALKVGGVSRDPVLQGRDGDGRQRP